MPGPSLVQRQVDVLKDLARLAVDRATRETKAEAEFNKDKAAADRQYQAARQGIVRRRDMEVQAIEGDIGNVRASLASQFPDRHRRVAPSAEQIDDQSDCGPGDRPDH